ncbi:MAG: hypothetical protein JWO31_2911 [Phycisphaerales bacterium]|nr:hypothetical protein [Phycisphaerales bacterium]
MQPWPVGVPLLVIGGTVALYWYRVLRMARKQRRRTGRAANLVPPEPLGRALRVLWAPAVTCWMAQPVASAFGGGPGWARWPAALRPVVDVGWARWACAAAVVAGYLATRACWARMGASWRMGIDPGERTPLVVGGPFAYVRHPIYALSAGMMAAAAAAVPSPLMLAAAVVHIGLLWWESSREERHLLAAHGPAYADYRRRVGRLVPRSVRGYVPGG